MADLISEIVAPEALEQLRESKQLLKDNFDELQKVIDSARKMSDSFKGVKDFKGLNDVVKQQEDIAKKLTDTENKYTEAVFTAAQKRQRAVEMANARMEAIERRRIEQAVKNAEREEKILGKLNNEYEQLKKKYNEAAAEAKRLGIAMGTNSKEFINASKSAKGMYEQLLKVELAVGQGQRQVGQYNQAAFAMQQVLRETPSIANGFSQWVMAISNNLPILTDAIQDAVKANKELKAAGAQTIPVWKQLASGIFSISGIATIAISALTILAAKTDLFKTKADEAASSAENFADALNNISVQGSTKLKKEVFEASTLIKIVEDSTRSQEVRAKAFNELLDLYPQYLKNLTVEDMLKGKAYDALLQIKEEINYRAELDILQQRRNKMIERQLELSSKLNGMTKVGEGETKYKLETELEKVNAQLAETEKNILDMKVASMTFPDKPEKEKKPKREFIKAEDDLMKAIFDREKQRLEIEKTTQKEISDNTEAELSDRLIAYQRYMAAVIQILQMEKDLSIDIEQAKINELESRKKGASKIEIANLVNDQKAAYARMMAAAERFNADLAQVEADGRKEIFDITKSANAEWLNNEQLAYAQMKQLDAAALMTTEQLLRHDYDKKLISRRKYNQELSKLQLMAHKMELDNEIKHLENLLNSDKLTAEKRLELANQLANAKRNRALAEKGVQSKSANRRPTDSLAMMLGTPEEGMEEQYMQAFYDNTVDMANKAADAIIAANQRRFQAEKEQLDRQAEQYKAYYERQSQFIKDTVQDETERNKQLAQLDAQRAAKEAEIEAKKKDIAIRQARFEKASAIASITQNTAVAIAKAIAQFTVAAPPIVALIAAAGAVQLAAAASTPIPQYRTGTDYHKGGAFIAGDGGEHELIVAPNKAPYLSNNTSTLYNEVAGTKVIPLSKISNYAGSDNMSLDIAGLIVNGFDRTGKKLASVIMASKPNINMDAMAEQMRRERNLQGK